TSSAFSTGNATNNSTMATKIDSFGGVNNSSQQSSSFEPISRGDSNYMSPVMKPQAWQPRSGENIFSSSVGMGAPAWPTAQEAAPDKKKGKSSRSRKSSAA